MVQAKLIGNTQTPECEPGDSGAVADLMAWGLLLKVCFLLEAADSCRGYFLVVGRFTER